MFLVLFKSRTMHTKKKVRFLTPEVDGGQTLPRRMLYATVSRRSAPTFFLRAIYLSHLRKLLRYPRLRPNTDFETTKKKKKAEKAALTLFNPLTIGNPFWGTKLLGFSIGRGSGALKGLSAPTPLRIESYSSGSGSLASGSGSLASGSGSLARVNPPLCSLRAVLTYLRVYESSMGWLF